VRLWEVVRLNKLWGAVFYFLTLGVGGVDPVNNIILYVIILYIIYTYTAYGFPIRAALLRQDQHQHLMLLSASAEFMTSWQCLNNACSDVSALSPPQKNWVIRFPPYFAQGILWMTSENAQIFMKIWRLVSEKFFETENIFSGLPLYRGSGC